MLLLRRNVVASVELVVVVVAGDLRLRRCCRSSSPILLQVSLSLLRDCSWSSSYVVGQADWHLDSVVFQTPRGMGEGGGAENVIVTPHNLVLNPPLSSRE